MFHVPLAVRPVLFTFHLFPLSLGFRPLSFPLPHSEFQILSSFFLDTTLLFPLEFQSEIFGKIHLCALGLGGENSIPYYTRNSYLMTKLRPYLLKSHHVYT